MAGWNVQGFTELRTLGSGAFGEVVLARHDGSGTQVAIKYLKQNLLEDAEFTEAFRSEAAILASVNDPHVVRLYEYAETPQGAAIVLELVDGVCLREILKNQGATTAEAALVILTGSLLGLAAAHRQGVVHRDYKPGNVLVNGDGDSKLTDFGIAARAGDSPIPAGTLVYAPPEQIEGSPASPAGDVYAATGGAAARAVVATGTALALTGAHQPGSPGHPDAALHLATLQPPSSSAAWSPFPSPQQKKGGSGPVDDAGARGPAVLDAASGPRCPGLIGRCGPGADAGDDRGGDAHGELRRAGQLRYPGVRVRGGWRALQPSAHEGGAEGVARAGGVPGLRRVGRDQHRGLAGYR